jgi:hypothetical protein
MEEESRVNLDLQYISLPTLWWHYRNAVSPDNPIQRYRVVRGLGVGCILRGEHLHLVVVSEDQSGNMKVVWDIEYVIGLFA